MNTYHVIIDESMIRNAIQTNINESIDLFSIKQVIYFILLGFLPSYFVFKVNIINRTLKDEILNKLKVIIINLLIIVLIISLFSKFYTSFIREHKPLRYSINPTYWMYSIGKYINLTYSNNEIILKQHGLNASIDDNKKRIAIIVVGEASRADHFSLNGYNRQTNPLLEQENIINFNNFYSCGTSTAVSVPCMFSILNKDDYSYKKGISNENVLDVLKHTNKVSILWRDNNSNSKGVAIRVKYEDYKSSKNNTICIEGECRDEGMLVGLDEYIKNSKNNNILIVLHQMGNHGPAYYKRYIKEFEKYKPTCKTNQLEKCTKDEISNAYDNGILYTDYFLSKIINFLKQYENNYKTTMLYISDHGESLGEKGIYLHGLPYFMAPDAQTHVGAILWQGSSNNKKLDTSKKYTQDYLFHTLLGIFNTNAKEYNKNLDILNDLK